MHCLERRGTYSRGITELVLLTRKNLPQDTTHDLATSRLGQIGNNKDSLGSCEWTNTFSYLKNEVFTQLIVDFVSVLDGDESVDGLAG